MTFPMPNPSNGYQGLPSSENREQQNRFYGDDIYFDIAAPDVELGQADYVVDATGDWQTVNGPEALRQSLTRRLITNPGEWQTKPEYGCGARQYVKAKNTPTERAELEARIRSNFLRDPRVERVDTVTITPLDDGSAGVKIEVYVTPRGRLRADKSLPVRIEIR
jgi:phage baseplate assembly protein W